MKRIKKYISSVLCGAMILSLVGCNMIEKTPEAISNTILAKVGDKKITRGDVDKSISYILEYYKSQYGDDFEENEDLVDTLKAQRESALESLIEQEVLLANKDKIGADYTDEEVDKEVEEQINSIKESTENDEEKYKEYLKSCGYSDEEELKEEVKKSVILNKLREKMVEGQEVTDEEISDYYNENIDSFKVQPGADVKHILFTDETTGEADAKAARELVLQGKTFDEIAAMDEYKDKCTTEDLGFQQFENNTSLVEEFVEGFKNLKEGEVSEPVKTSYGWHLIEISNIQNEEVTKTLDEVKDEIKENLLSTKENNKYTEELEKLKEDTKIKKYENRI